MALKFGTSGLRGLVKEMTDKACYLYVRAFARYLKEQSAPRIVSLAGDMRRSTPRIMQAAATALCREGFKVENCGFISTPAVTYWGIAHHQGSIMVTGSHIPDDRNGIKFNMPWGEVLKNDEIEISRIYKDIKQETADTLSFEKDDSFSVEQAQALDAVSTQALETYIHRYIDYFPNNSLSGKRYVMYQHSTVCRDFLIQILESLGAEVIPVGRSETFVPVDTEAVQEPEKLAQWILEHKADGLITADGDGDRPLVVDEKGVVIRGDVLGILVAKYFDADSVSVPVSCNTSLEKSGFFKHIQRTRIGSPYVIESMNHAIRKEMKKVVGYEANGGFLLGTDLWTEIGGEKKCLEALPTRDAVLPIIAVLIAVQQSGQTLSELISALPSRYTWSGLQRGVPREQGQAFVEKLKESGKSKGEEIFGTLFGPIESIDFTDGVRMTFVSGNIVHLRPSGNAPEFRCYTESQEEKTARDNNRKALDIIGNLLGK